MSWNRRLVAVLLVGLAMGSLTACDGPGSDWPKGASSTPGGTMPTRAGEDPKSGLGPSALDAGVLDAGTLDARVVLPSCSVSDASVGDAGVETHEAGVVLTPDSGCR